MAQLVKPPDWYWLLRSEYPNATQKWMAKKANLDRSMVSKYDAYIRAYADKIKETQERERAALEKGEELPTRPYPENLWELTVDHLEALLDDFLIFRDTYFRTPRNEPFITKPFHLAWIEGFLHALVTGGRLVILSPPRHGKTELLVHFCTFLIVRFPMIRILWVGGSESIARRSLSQVKAQLTTNGKLIEENLDPMGRFKPDRADSLPWTASEFTVATRPFPIKGTSMTAIGRGGTLLSLDADLLIADDIEDARSTGQPGMRESTREWWTSQFESRKMADTALCLIGSRQHPDDLAGHLIENEAYETIVETAHDPACTIPQDDPAQWPDHTKCMLFPEMAPFSWLKEQQKAAANTGGLANFEMVYLNITHPKGAIIFTPEVVNQGLDRGRVIGHVPSNTRLVAGLDPSGTGYQAAFLWAVSTDPFKLYMVDMENNQGGGMHEARRIMEEWKGDYGVNHWVVEQTMWANGLDQDHDLKDWASRNGIVIEGHQTYSYNKWDEGIGVSQFVTRYLENEISLPYQDGPSQEKVDIYRHQLIYFSSNKSTARGRTIFRKGYTSDLVMASWFPMSVVRRIQSEAIADMGVEVPALFETFANAAWDSPPWDNWGFGDEFDDVGLQL